MPILFCAVIHDRTVVGRFATCDGNFDEILGQVILQIPEDVSKITYSHGRYLLHCINDVRSIYFCITDRTCQRSRAFLFLNEVKRKYRIKNGEFDKTLADEMYRYNEDYSTIVIRSGELEELNAIGVESSESLLGEKLLLVENDQTMHYSNVSSVDTSPQKVTITDGKKTFSYNIIIISVIFIGLLIKFSATPYLAMVVILLLYFYYSVTR